MKLFVYLVLQLLIFLPLTSLAADGGVAPITQNHKNTEITEAQKANINDSYGKLPLYFIENNGQVNNAVKFYEKGPGHATFFTKNGVVLSLTKREGKTEKPSFKKDILGLKTEKSEKATTETVSLSFVGANKEANRPC